MTAADRLAEALRALAKSGEVVALYHELDNEGRSNRFTKAYEKACDALAAYKANRRRKVNP